MHIEPGYIASAKILAANAVALGVVGSQAKRIVQQPQLILKSLIAGVFFTLFMQSFHMPVGPSELHFLGAMAIYLSLGFTPTLLGFGLGLLLQGLVFEPADLLHLGVNFLSLALPLMLVHKLQGDAAGKLPSVAAILQRDAVFYSGVTAMVGFWLSIGEVATPFSAWAAFTASYIPVVMAEPLLTLAVLHLVHKGRDLAAVRYCFTARAV